MTISYLWEIWQVWTRKVEANWTVTVDNCLVVFWEAFHRGKCWPALLSLLTSSNFLCKNINLEETTTLTIKSAEVKGPPENHAKLFRVLILPWSHDSLEAPPCISEDRSSTDSLKVNNRWKMTGIPREGWRHTESLKQPGISSGMISLEISGKTGYIWKTSWILSSKPPLFVNCQQWQSRSPDSNCFLYRQESNLAISSSPVTKIIYRFYWRTAIKEKKRNF